MPVFNIHPKSAERPRAGEVWAIASRRMRLWITPDDAPPFRPYVVLVFDLTHGYIVGQEVEQTTPNAEIMFGILQRAIRKPLPRTGKARRPKAVYVETAPLADALRAPLAQMGIDCAVQELPFLNQALRDMQQLLSEGEGEAEQPGLLSVEGVTPEFARHLFAAAAAFYRAEPWMELDSDSPIAMCFPASNAKECYVSVMGMGGTEYGIAIYHDWNDFLKLYLQEGDTPEDLLAERGHLTVMFDDVTFLPIDDSEAIEQHGWEVAGEDAYPLIMEFHRGKDKVRRPTRDELVLLEAALLAVPRVVEECLEEDEESESEDFKPFEAKLTLNTFEGERDVIVRYPAGELPIEARSAAGLIWGDDDEDDEEDEDEGFEMPDRRALDSVMAQLLGGLGAQPMIGDEKLKRAQELMYKAFESPNAGRRIKLAHEALSISPKCADAWVLLAEEEADTLARKLDYFRKGVEAGERALGQPFFKKNKGYFWGILETRPYMRARLGVISALLELHRFDEAITDCRDMLALNPGDNQGVRYILLTVLMDAGREDEARALIKQYKDDVSPEWTYTQALLTFQQGGRSKQSDKLLREALRWNKHVPAYLTGRKRIPAHQPDYITFGGEDQAAEYARAHLNHWRRTPGAVEWLKSVAK